MENLVAFVMHDDEHKRQMARANAEGWQSPDPRRGSG
jgi:hypothetical protein